MTDEEKTEQAQAKLFDVLVANVASKMNAWDPENDANLKLAAKGIDPMSPTAELEVRGALFELRRLKPYLFRVPGSNGSGVVTPFNPGARN